MNIKVLIIILLFSKLSFGQVTGQYKLTQIVNSEIGYEIQYPSDWYLKKDTSFSNDYAEVLLIENIEEEVVVAGGGPFTENGSFFKLVVFLSDHEDTIIELIMSGDLSERVKQSRLEQVKEIEIGGITTFVWIGSGWADRAYDFIYKGKRFRFHFMSGSKEQFVKDTPIFEKMLSSFRILK